MMTLLSFKKWNENRKPCKDLDSKKPIKMMYFTLFPEFPTFFCKLYVLPSFNQCELAKGEILLSCLQKPFWIKGLYISISSVNAYHWQHKLYLRIATLFFKLKLCKSNFNVNLMFWYSCLLLLLLTCFDGWWLPK